jgi:hypothetical protein
MFAWAARAASVGSRRRPARWRRCARARSGPGASSSLGVLAPFAGALRVDGVDGLGGEFDELAECPACQLWQEQLLGGGDVRVVKDDQFFGDELGLIDIYRL